MSIFRTHIPNQSYSYQIHHQHPILAMGSCFAAHIGTKLADYKFQSMLNPFGILYNPYSIGHALECLIENRKYQATDLFQARGLWHSFDHHGLFSNAEQEQTLQQINQAIEAGHHFLSNCERLILTFGTSKVFVHKANQQIVANCHKLDNQDFERVSLRIPKILQKLRPSLQQIKAKNPKLEILLTLSPVRHIRDGHIENQRSKARLLLACEQLCQEFDYVHYFPSYEILMDDLRDYRFYQADMIHPNSTAIDYIWTYFEQSFFNDSTLALNKKVRKVLAAAKHRPIHPESTIHQNFIEQQVKQIQLLIKEHPFLDFKQELAHYKNQRF